MLTCSGLQSGANSKIRNRLTYDPLVKSFSSNPDWNADLAALDSREDFDAFVST